MPCLLNHHEPGRPLRTVLPPSSPHTSCHTRTCPAFSHAEMRDEYVMTLRSHPRRIMSYKGNGHGTSVNARHSMQALC